MESFIPYYSEEGRQVAARMEARGEGQQRQTGRRHGMRLGGRLSLPFHGV
jgi:hypothetical protein